MAAKKSDKRRRRKSRIKTRPIPPKEDMRKNPPLTILQTRFISALATSNSATEAAGKAGYSPKNLDKSAHQVMKALRGRVPQILDDLGLDEEIRYRESFSSKAARPKRVHYFQKDGEVTDIQLSEDLPIADAGDPHASSSCTAATRREDPERGRTVRRARSFADRHSAAGDCIQSVRRCHSRDRRSPRHGVKPLNSTPTDPKPPAKPPTNEDES